MSQRIGKNQTAIIVAIIGLVGVIGPSLIDKINFSSASISESQIYEKSTDFNINSIIGRYENHLYDGTDKKNDWHYVNITKIDDQTLLWTNSAGVSWRLSVTTDRNYLYAGNNPYSNDGYNRSRIIWQRGRVTGITGPWDELYERSR